MKHSHIAIALIWRDGQVLIAQRPPDAEHLPGVWEFPGGKCEEGETPAICARREVREEIGVEVKVIDEHPPITYEYSDRRVTLHPIDCNISSGEPQPVQCTELRWVAPQELGNVEFPPANAGLIQSLKRNES